MQHHADATCHQQPVQKRNIDLPFHVTREQYLVPWPYVQTDGFVDERKATTDQCLAGDDSRQCSDDDGRYVKAIRNDMIKRANVTQWLTRMLYQPRCLPCIA